MEFKAVGCNVTKAALMFLNSTLNNGNKKKQALFVAICYLLFSHITL